MPQAKTSNVCAPRIASGRIASARISDPTDVMAMRNDAWINAPALMSSAAPNAASPIVDPSSPSRARRSRSAEANQMKRMAPITPTMFPATIRPGSR